MPETYNPRRLARVVARLHEMGYDFPPDAIVAVDEGRETYVPRGGSPTYSVDRSTSGMVSTVRVVISAAIRREFPGWHDPRGDVHGVV